MGLTREIGKIFKSIGRHSVRSKKTFTTLLHTSKPLRNLSKKLGKKILTKKGITYTSAAAAIGITSQYVTDYIRNNSGCFLFDKKDKPICKIRDLSCCSQNNAPNALKFCDDLDEKYSLPKLFINDESFQNSSGNRSPCFNYEDEGMGSCCKYCDCLYHKCDEGVTMKCQNPTIGEAMSHIAGTVGSGILSTTLTIFPFLKGFGIIMLCILVLSILINFMF